ncbi:2Fe-2S iron-sulfur cluster-binding protein [Vibrio zhugei]|uniref:2Fe-2S iron-sulfur cluster-binding protein n=1 Tax=Vibrio zhugei TaxID=2479546 RepID=A0ABV7C4L3_9VIBR|nr:hybrid-cluster NAD(P)-dependent oxidoreductase [Vibrio zhugei]
MFFEWHGQQPQTLRCIDKYFETDDSVSIRLADCREPRQFQFKPGQFVNVGVPIDGHMVYRAYSISSPSHETYLQLTIKRVRGGTVSNYLLDTLQVDDTVQVLPPTGNFNCIDNPPQSHQGQAQVLLLSAGCGITPVFAMAQHWLNQTTPDEWPADIVFVHSARSPEATIYYDQLETLDAVYDHFHLQLVLKNRDGTAHTQGRLSESLLKRLVPDVRQRTVYLCGPSQYMQDTVTYLHALGCDMANVYQESFTPTRHSHAKAERALPNVQVAVPKYAQTIHAQPGQLLADVLEEAGLPLVTACRSGICGSCKCRVTRGEVVTTSQDTLTDEEIAKGYVLACSASINTDVDVEIG